MQTVRAARKIQRSKKTIATNNLARTGTHGKINSPTSFRVGTSTPTSARLINVALTPYTNSPSGGAMDSPENTDGPLSPLSLMSKTIPEEENESSSGNLYMTTAANVALATTKLVKKGRKQKDKKKYSTVNNYLIIKDIAEGSFGKVKLVEDQNDDNMKQYAMKVIKRNTNNHKKGGIQKYGANDQDQGRYTYYTHTSS